MKKGYVKPCVEGVILNTAYGFMVEGSKGQVSPEEDAMAKVQTLVDDDDDFTSETASAEPQVFFSNDYIKEVWN